MIDEQLRGRGIRDERVLSAMAKVPREAFLRAEDRQQAYGDYPLPIGEGQTISQPYIVAAMLEILDLRSPDRVLEIGTGTGYEAAILGELVAEVWTIERYMSWRTKPATPWVNSDTRTCTSCTAMAAAVCPIKHRSTRYW